MSSRPAWIVSLEFKRIQTYLFSSPLLRAMLGANATLGEVIRVRLPELAREHNSCCCSEEVANAMPSADRQDPLNAAELPMRDDPQRLYREYGVLARDGGHFHATFPERHQAEAFVGSAIELVCKRLPGILIDAKIKDLNPWETCPRSIATI